MSGFLGWKGGMKGRIIKRNKEIFEEDGFMYYVGDGFILWMYIC